MIHSYKTCGCAEAFSGVLVGPHTLLTSGQTCVCPVHGGTAEHMDIWFGRDADTNWLYYTDQYTAYAMTDFVGRNGDHYYTNENNWSVIELKEDIGNELGWFGLCTRPDDGLYTHRAYIAGYVNGAFGTEIITTGETNPPDQAISGGTYEGYSDLIGAPVFDVHYNVVGIRNGKACARITDRMLDLLRSSIPSWYSTTASKPSVDIPADVLSGANLQGTWKMIYNSRGGNKSLEDGSMGTEYVFMPHQLEINLMTDGIVYAKTHQDYKYEYSSVYLTRLSLAGKDETLYPYDRLVYVKDGQLHIEDRGELWIFKRIGN